jgi:hypothetical protein
MSERFDDTVINWNWLYIRDTSVINPSLVAHHPQAMPGATFVRKKKERSSCVAVQILLLLLPHLIVRANTTTVKFLRFPIDLHSLNNFWGRNAEIAVYQANRQYRPGTTPLLQIIGAPSFA